MKQWLFILFMIISPSNASANEKVRLALSEYAWEKRQLIVFAPSSENKQYLLFKKVEAEFRDEFEERKLHTWHVIANDSVRLESTVNATVNEKINNSITNQDFRDTYNVSKNEFRLLLIGYDQGEKLRQEKVNIDYLFAEIDQMPMRIQEMQ